jgi:hypothetical protein
MLTISGNVIIVGGFPLNEMSGFILIAMISVFFPN